MIEPENDTIYAILLDFIGEVGVRHVLPHETTKNLLDRVVKAEKECPIHTHPIFSPTRD